MLPQSMHSGFPGMESAKVRKCEDGDAETLSQSDTKTVATTGTLHSEAGVGKLGRTVP